MIPFIRRSSQGTSSSSSYNSSVPDFLAPLTIRTHRQPLIRFNSTSTNPSTSSATSSSSSAPPKPVKEQFQPPKGKIGTAAHKSLHPNQVDQPPSAAKKHQAQSNFTPMPRAGGKVQSTRRKPIDGQTSRSSQYGKILSTDPLSLLTHIRASASQPSFPTSDSTSTTSTSASTSTLNSKARVHPPTKYITAYRNLKTGITATVLDFGSVFERGWKPLKLAGEVGRIHPLDHEPLISIVGREFNTSGKESRVNWNELKELLLWSSGMNLMPGVTNWAWDSMKGSSIEGSEKVVEIWDAIMKGEPTRMRLSSSAFDRNSKSPFPTTKKPTIDTSLFGAYIVARSILHTAAGGEVVEPFSVVIPTFLNPSHPTIGRYLARINLDLSKQLQQLFKSSPSTTNPLEAKSKAEAWLRQIQLAQQWLRTGKGNGLGIILTINQGFRRDDQVPAIKYWAAIKEGVESPTVGWIEDKWESSKEDHLVEGMTKEDILGTLPGSIVDPTSTSTAIATEEDLNNPLTTTFVERPTKAYLTQALLAPFLTGFVRSKLFDRATEIWNWLENPSSPLVPGVVSWTALLRGYALMGDIEAAETVFRQMQEAGVQPDSVTWINLIDGYFKSKDLVKVNVALEKLFSDKGLKENSSANGGKFEEEIYRKLISGFLSIGKLDRAKAVLEDMMAIGVKPSIHSYNLFFKHYTVSSKADFPSIVKTLRLISEQGLEPDVFTFTMILKGLLSVDRSDAMSKLISIMQNSNIKPTVTTYGAIINYLCLTGSAQKLRAAMELLDEMERSGMITNEIIYTTIIQGFIRGIRISQAVDLEEGEVHPYLQAAIALRARMDSRKIPMNRIGYNALIDASLYMNSTTGNQLALSLFKELQSKLSSKSTSGEVGMTGESSNVTLADTWYVLLHGFSENGDWSNARGVLRMMQENKFVVKSNVMKRLVDNVMRGGSN